MRYLYFLNARDADSRAVGAHIDICLEKRDETTG